MQEAGWRDPNQKVKWKRKGQVEKQRGDIGMGKAFALVMTLQAQIQVYVEYPICSPLCKTLLPPSKEA